MTGAVELVVGPDAVVGVAGWPAVVWPAVVWEVTDSEPDDPQAPTKTMSAASRIGDVRMQRIIASARRPCQTPRQ